MPPVRYGDPRPVAVLSSDWHFSDRPPLIRSAEPDWQAAMARPMSQVRELCHKHDVPLLHAGDLFDRWNPSPALIAFAMRELPLSVYAVPGQHDLRHHRLDSLQDTAFGVLVEAGRISYPKDNSVGIPGWASGLTLYGFPWGTEVVPCPERHQLDTSLHVAVIHSYIWIKGYSYTGADEGSHLRSWAGKLKGYDVAVFGDNHMHFYGPILRVIDKETEIVIPVVWNCVLPGNRVQGNVLACSRSLYSGKAIEIRTVGGRTVRVTGNHPILTPSGFVAANSIHEGQYLLNGERKVDPSASHNKEDGPPLIEDIFRSLSQIRPGVRRLARPRFVEEFHGDARFIKGDVDIVYAKGELLSHPKPQNFQCICHDVLNRSSVKASQKSGFSPGHLSLFGILLSSTSLLRCACLQSPLFVRQGVHLPFGVLGNDFPLFNGQIVRTESRPFCGGSRYDPRFNKNTHKSEWLPISSLPVPYRQPELLGQFVQTLPCEVSPDQLRTIRDSTFSVPNDHPRLSQELGEGGPRDSHVGGDTVQRFAGKITMDQVVAVREFDFHGYVYDLQTDDGLIIANTNSDSIGILISNCGTLLRRKSDEMDYRPCVGLLWSDGHVEQVFLDTSRDSYLEDVRGGGNPLRAAELEQLIEDLKGASDDPLDFREALHQALKKLKCPQGVRKLVLEHVGE